MNTIQTLLTDHLDIWTAADTEKKSGRGRSSGNAASVYGIKKLRELILELAVRGKLVPQDSKDEPVSQLLKRIQAEKVRLIAEGKIKKDKPLPPITEDEKPYELPQGWEWARLGFLGNTQTGATPSKSITESFGADVPFIKPGDIYSNHVDYCNEGLSFLGAERSGRIAQSDSLLMVCIGTIGKCNLIERSCSFNQQINSITPYFFDSRYLLSVCRSNYFQSEAWAKSSSTTIAILNKGNWEEICIPMPPLAEQHRIVAKVDELMAMCDQLEQQQTHSIAAHQALVEALLGTLARVASQQEFSAAWACIANHFDTLFTSEASIDQLKQTILQLAVMGKLVPQDPNDEPASALVEKISREKARLIKDGVIKNEKSLPSISNEEIPFDVPGGWVWQRLGELGFTQTGGTPSKTNKEYFGNDISFIKPGDIYPGYVDYDNEGLSTEGAKKLGRSAPAGSILMVCIGTIGKCNMIERTCAFNQQINSITPYMEMSGYLLNTLSSVYFQKAAWERSSSTTIAILNKGKWVDIVVPIPPLEEQHRIVTKADELMALCDALKARLADAKAIQLHLADAIVEQAVC